MNLLDRFKKKTLPIILDIGEKDIQIIASSDKISTIKTPPDSINDGLIVKTNELAQAIKRLLHRERIRTKDRRFFVIFHSSQSILKISTTPILSDKKTYEYLQNEIESFVMFAGIETSFNYFKLSVENEHDKRQVKFLVGATRTEIINSYIGLFSLLNYDFEILTLPIIPVLNQLGLEGARAEIGNVKTAALIDEKQAYFVVLKEGRLQFIHVGKPDEIEEGISECHSFCRLKELKDPENVEIHREKVIPAFGHNFIQTRKAMIDFVSHFARQEHKAQKSFLSFLSFTLILSMGMLVAFFMVHFAIFSLEDQIKEIQTIIAIPSEDVERVVEADKKTKGLIGLYNKRKELLKGNNIEVTIDDLIHLSALIPRECSISQLSFLADRLVLNGRAKSSASAYKFEEQLKTVYRRTTIDLVIDGEVAKFRIEVFK